MMTVNISKLYWFHLADIKITAQDRNNSWQSWYKILCKNYLLGGWLDADELGCFKFLETQVNLYWVEAQQKCEEIGGYLAEPSTTRQEILSNYFYKKTILASTVSHSSTWSIFLIMLLINAIIISTIFYLELSFYNAKDKYIYVHIIVAKLMYKMHEKTTAVLSWGAPN